MRILGVNFETHESSVVLVEDGRIIFAASEERYSRIKMDDELPVRALQAAWAHTGLKPEQIDI
ncbi:MAG: carbamoyltransferase N-terminal domain-containing protein, partial [bacterium]|nr:carbamoyltransferase N-terminal domain-containing protein [bacterium]